MRPRIGLTIGDPAGIGPEVTLKAASEEVLAACAPVIIGDAQYLSHWARVFGLSRGFDCVNAGAPIPLEQNTPIIYNLNNIPGSIEMGREQAGVAAPPHIHRGRVPALSFRAIGRGGHRAHQQKSLSWRDTLSQVTRSFWPS